MKFRALYWGIGLLLIGAAGLEYRQHRQEQRQLQWKLRLLDATLQVGNAQTREESERILREIRWAIERNNQQPRDLVLLHETEEIRQRADETVKSIVAFRGDLLRGRSAEGQDNREPGNMAVAYSQLSERVAAYVSFAKPFTIQSSHPAIGKAVSLNALMDTEEEDGSGASLNALMDTEEEDGSGASITQVMAMTSQKEAVVRANELFVLQCQREKIGCGLNIVSDAFGAFASAESNTVAVGDQYKGELFLTSVYGLPILDMTVNGRPIAVGPDKRGHVEFTVPPLVDQTPSGQAYWTGRIRALVKGRDSTFTVKVPYTVRAN